MTTAGPELPPRLLSSFFLSFWTFLNFFCPSLLDLRVPNTKHLVTTPGPQGLGSQMTRPPHARRCNLPSSLLRPAPAFATFGFMTVMYPSDLNVGAPNTGRSRYTRSYGFWPASRYPGLHISCRCTLCSIRVRGCSHLMCCAVVLGMARLPPFLTPLSHCMSFSHGPSIDQCRDDFGR